MTPQLLVALATFCVAMKLIAFWSSGDKVSWMWIGESIVSAATLSVRGTNEFVDKTGDALRNGLED